MTCDEVAKVVALETLIEEAGGERELRSHALGCATCRDAIETFLDDEALLRERFAERVSAVARRGRHRLALPLALAASFLLALGVGWLVRAARAPAVARVVALRGPVAADGHALAPGDGLRGGPLVTTAADAAVELELDDGSRLSLAGESALRPGPGRARGELAAFLESGRVRCTVRAGGGAFRIATPRGEITALGTEFDVAFTPARDDDPAARRDGVAVMTGPGGFPKTALLTVAVLSGVVEFRRAAFVQNVRAQETLVAEGDDAPRVVKLTTGESPREVPAFDPLHVHLVQRMVSAIALAPDGAHLAICVRQMSGGEIGDGGPRFVGVHRLDLASDRLDGFVGLDGSPSSAVFTPDGRLWATEAMNNELRRVDFAQRGLVDSLDLNDPPNQLTSDDARLYPSPDGRHVVVTGFNDSKTLYAYPGWKRESVLEGPAECLPCEGAWSADGKEFVAGSRDNALRVWRIGDGKATSSRLAGEGIAPTFGPGNKIFALTTDAKAFGPAQAQGDERRLFVSDAATWNEASFSRDGRLLALGRVDGTVTVYDFASRKPLQTVDYTAPPETNPTVSCLVWAPDASWLAIGRFDGSSWLVRFKGK